MILLALIESKLDTQGGSGWERETKSINFNKQSNLQKTVDNEIYS